MKQQRGLGAGAFPIAVVAVVTMMVIPLPTAILDLLLAVNIGVSVLLLLASLNVKRALDLGAFPSLLLIATLFRLALNVSSARLILADAEAGKVIEAFGTFVIGGSLVVGLVVFLILVVIQFVVITQGATRVAEVAARFTLDAMPGKQMAIDADLNAGIIDDDEARRRRQDISAEADFYGAMDGASKFVKGDAIAAIVITAVNLIGGLIIGVVQHKMDVGDAVATYSLLTVGDGLVSQIPALLVSISAGLIITRAAGSEDLGSDVAGQFARQHRAIRTGGLALAGLGLVPGLPKAPFLAVGLGAWLIGRRLAAADDQLTVSIDELPPVVVIDPDAPSELSKSLRVEPLSLELAMDLVDLVDPNRDGDLLDRVRALRRKMAQELGIVIPPVRTRDNLELELGTYAVKVHGVTVATGQAPAGQVLAILDDLSLLPGLEVREPVFGLPAKWVPVEQEATAEALGATVVDRASVITTHLAEIARRHGPELLSRQDVKMLVEIVREHDPTVVDDLTGAGVGLAEVQRVLQLLLEEGVPVRDLTRILEIVSERARTTREPELLVESVRLGLAPTVCSLHAPEGRLPVVTFDPLMEQTLLNAVTRGELGSQLALDPDTAQRLATGLARQVRTAEDQGFEPVVICAPGLRVALHSFVARLLPHVPVMSYDELVDHVTIEDLGMVSLDETTPI
ncbi:MAG: flagellar biosynthesis protein FlhA [Microthrixaceae bacterium]|nr:flagellar biosynthesis protein FlhA [Microthrixaceae bacterium]